jgi:signal peptidase I
MSEDCDRGPPVEKAAAYAHDGGSLSLSNTSLIVIIRDILARGVPFRFAAPGFSMSPFIRDRDIITLAPYEKTSCRIGTVVAFVRPGTGQLVVHRVVAASGDGWRIKGDNNPEEDGVIPHAAILGQVIQVERAGKFVRHGLGPERVIIALLSRWNLLFYLLYPIGKLYSVIRRCS